MPLTKNAIGVKSKLMSIIPKPTLNKEPLEKNYYATFVADISSASVQRFTNNLAVVSQQAEPNKHLNIMIQSSGGTIADGIALFNVIKASPVKITVYNCGTIQSVATLCFLAATDRIADKHSTFMMHAATIGPMPAPTEKLENIVATLKIEDARLDALFRERLKLSAEKWASLRHHELWFTAEDAVTSGIATAIGSFSVPLGEKLLSFCL